MDESKSFSRTINNYLKCIPSRLVLYFLMLTCIIVSFMMKSVINLTILAMVKEYNTSDLNETNGVQKLCYTNDNITPTKISYGGTLDWSMDVQYYILTSYFWTYVIAQVLGGIAEKRFGTKVVIGYALITSSLCTLAIPLASLCHYVLVIILQMVHGFVQGLTWPALYAIVSCWVPIQEKSRFLTCFQGLLIGTMLSQLISGFIIASFGWEYAFYVMGGLGLLWSLLWYFLAHNTPESHPKISENERNYIKENREPNLHSQKHGVPWISMLCSLPLWSIAISSLGRMWFVSTVNVYGPLYLKTVIGLNIQMNGAWSGIISFGCFVSSLIFSYTSDKIESHKIITTLFNRKLFAAVGQILPGLLFVLIGYLNCNTSLLLTVWAASQMLNTANFIASIVNTADLTPNFGGHAIGIIQTVMMSCSIFAPLVAKSFLSNGNTLENWRGIFCVTSGVLFASYLFYVIFSSARIQKWDNANGNRTTSKLQIEADIGEELLVLHK